MRVPWPAAMITATQRRLDAGCGSCGGSSEFSIKVSAMPRHELGGECWAVGGSYRRGSEGVKGREFAVDSLPLRSGGSRTARAVAAGR